MSTERAGVVMAYEDRRVFFSTEVVRAVVRMPKITRVPGAPEGVLGLSYTHGEIIPVWAVAAPSNELLICEWLGEALGLSGLTAVATGLFPQAPSGILYDGQVTPAFDLEPIGQRLLYAGTNS